MATLREAVTGCHHGCALMRLSSHIGPIQGDAMLDEAAASVGFTKAEAYGIMDGWDSYYRDAALFAYASVSLEHPIEYNAGLELGASLYRSVYDPAV